MAKSADASGRQNGGSVRAYEVLGRSHSVRPGFAGLQDSCRIGHAENLFALSGGNAQMYRLCTSWRGLSGVGMRPGERCCRCYRPMGPLTRKVGGRASDLVVRVHSLGTPVKAA